MAKKSFLGASLLLATLGLTTPSYSQNPQEVQTKQQIHKYTLEQITSKNPPEDLTREDCLQAFKKFLGEKYESIEKAETPITESKKERWIKYWEGGKVDGETYEGASKERLIGILKDYNTYYTPISPNENLDKKFQSIQGFNFYLLFKYFPWMSYQTLTPQDKKVLIEHNKILKLAF